jgi:hypothetical protein
MKPGGIVALVLGLVFGIVWAVTAGAAQGCSFMGQLEGQTCYPGLVTMHGITGPLALVALVAGVVLLVAGQRQSPRFPRLPDCQRCGYQAAAHIDGRCPDERGGWKAL